MNWRRSIRKIHYWCSILVATPFCVILLSGMVLQVKKQVTWVQPATMTGIGEAPEIEFSRVLEVAKTVPEAQVRSWDDIARLDVRPASGIIKIRAKNNWETQIDSKTGRILQVRYRRSDLIESIHDGSVFHAEAKPWAFLSAAVGLLLLLVTGIYLFTLPYAARRRSVSRSAA